ncbi:MAG: hypothetical protein Q7S02_01040 [bacterium]|nr:hypothetical protein [bacterium]
MQLASVPGTPVREDELPLSEPEKILLRDVLAGIDAVDVEDLDAWRRDLHVPERPLAEAARIAHLLHTTTALEWYAAVAMSRLPEDVFDALGAIIEQHPNAYVPGFHTHGELQHAFELAGWSRDPPRH